MILAAAGIPVALLVLALPITWGYGGYNYHSDGGRLGIVYFLDPKGPAARAGLRLGDRVQFATGYAAMLENGGTAGTTVPIRVVRKGGVRTIEVTFVPFFGALAGQEMTRKILEAVTALGAFIVAILVLLRARDVRVGTRAAGVLFLAGAAALCSAAALVWGVPVVRVALATDVPILLTALGLWAMVWLLAIYPPNATKLRNGLVIAGVIPPIFGVLQICQDVSTYTTGNALPVIGHFLLSFQWTALLGVLFPLVPAVAIIDALSTADAAHRTPVRWLGGMWLIALALGAAPAALALAGSGIFFSHYGDALDAVTVFFIAFGVGYPVLRHRLVDLNILVTRATVFGTVSAVLVGLFVAAEWIIGRIFEQSMGFSNERAGFAAQALTLGVVLVLGISARSIHGFVEGRLNNTFFRKRLRGLAEIERVAHEADAATDARAIMELGVTTVAHCLDPLGAAFYVKDGDRYQRANSTGRLAFPSAYGYNDGPPLRLRRWQQPFEIDDESDNRHHMLFVPMSMRGELVGFLCCGPKPDRTAYLPDEIAALSLLAHHAGIASAWLSRTPVSAMPPLLST